MIRKQFAILSVVFCSLMCTSRAAADQLVNNGGFETGDLTGWTAAGAVTSSSFAPQFYGVDAQDAASGSFGAYLGSEFSTLTLSQAITLQPAHYYTVSFSLAQNSAPANGFTNLFSASFNGQNIFTEVNAPVSGFANYSFTLGTAPAFTGSGSLQFITQNDLGYFSLDNVSVSTGAATPEPATLLLIVPGLIGLAWLRRR